MPRLSFLTSLRTPLTCMVDSESEADTDLEEEEEEDGNAWVVVCFMFPGGAEGFGHTFISWTRAL